MANAAMSKVDLPEPDHIIEGQAYYAAYSMKSYANAFLRENLVNVLTSATPLNVNVQIPREFYSPSGGYRESAVISRERIHEILNDAINAVLQCDLERVNLNRQLASARSAIREKDAKIAELKKLVQTD